LDDPIAQGIANSPEAALDEAKQQCGDVCPDRYLAQYASGQWLKQQAIQRQQASTDGRTAQVREFAYACYLWDSDWDNTRRESITPHLIVRKTRTRIYIEREPYREDRQPSGEWYDYYRPTFVLDRQEWERTGKVHRKGDWRGDYYRDPELFRIECGLVSRAPCLEALELPANATMAQIKARFRHLSRSMHPDAGGDEKEFVRLRRYYEEALSLCAGR
jgi:hypothetical protein